MESKQVAERYGAGVLGVRFKYEDGYVIHVTGHFYTQPGQDAAVASAGRAFEQLSENVVSEKAADRGRIDGLYNAAPQREVMLQAAPSPSAPAVAAESVTTQKLAPKAKVRMLERRAPTSRSATRRATRAGPTPRPSSSRGALIAPAPHRPLRSARAAPPNPRLSAIFCGTGPAS